ncbi:MAG TPA: SDR family oxidoreductase [Bacteroidales bacterium]|nr:SDR family oxidoreductase [Bacteroidales bacterium]
MKTVVITGGTRGIGASLVKDFLKLGWNVAWSGTREKTVQDSLSSISVSYPGNSYAAFVCDVSVESDLKALWDNAAKKFGQIDIWVNNAGRGNEQSRFDKTDPATFMGIIDTNVKGLMLATHVACNRMLQQGHGAIYNMEGLGSDGRMISGLTPYGTSKRAVRYFSEAFAKEVNGSPVIIGTISPGMVLTDLTMNQVRKDPGNNRSLIKIYNILANEPETVTPFLVKRMTENRKNGAKITWLTKGKLLWSFLKAPFSKRDIVSKYL